MGIPYIFDPKSETKGFKGPVDLTFAKHIAVEKVQCVKYYFIIFVFIPSAIYSQTFLIEKINVLQCGISYTTEKKLKKRLIKY